jgi:hypothetical protein
MSNFKCPCIGGGGGGTRICTSIATVTKWEPDSTSVPKATKPADVVVSCGPGLSIVKVYDTPYGEGWDGAGPSSTQSTSSSPETCSPDGPLPPCKCGSERTDTLRRTVPDPIPGWGAGTSESKTFKIKFKAPWSLKATGCAGSSNTGTDDLTQDVSVSGKTYTKTWEAITETSKTCVL